MRTGMLRRASALGAGGVTLFLACFWLQAIARAEVRRVSAKPAWVPIIPSAQEAAALMNVRALPSQGFRLSAGLDPPLVPANGRSVLAVALQNVTGEPLRYPISDPELFLVVVMEDDSGNQLPLKQDHLGSALVKHASRVLDPGQVRVWEYQLGEMYDLTRPGKYRITVGRQVPRRDRPGDKELEYVVANSVALTVAEAAAPSPVTDAGGALFMHRALSAGQLEALARAGSAPLYGFRLTAMLPKPRIAPGERARMTLMLENVTRETLSCWRASARTEIRLIVDGPHGLAVPDMAPVTAISGQVTDIPPGQKLTDTFDINWLYDLSAIGEYRIVAVREMPRPEGLAYLVSNTVVLTVAPKP